ncbi:MAG: M28 family peptidase [Candidatus Peregrinibacteria bacterium]
MQTLREQAISFGENYPYRQLHGEYEAGDYLIGQLRDMGHNPVIQEFDVHVPDVQHSFARLTIDGQEFAGSGYVAAASQVSGRIDARAPIVDPNVVIGASRSETLSLIAFAPKSPDLPSLANMYDEVPTIAVSRHVRDALQRSRGLIHGVVEMDHVHHISRNILAGNTQNPRFLVLTHYDSIGKGIIDNASGIVVLLEAIRRNPKLLDDVCVAFCGSEELSGERGAYWAAGYRRLREEFSHLFERTEAIHVVDSVGNAPTRVFDQQYADRVSGGDTIFLGRIFGACNLAAEDIQRWRGKIRTIQAEDIATHHGLLFNVYHAQSLDDGRYLVERHLQDCVTAIGMLLSDTRMPKKYQKQTW